MASRTAPSITRSRIPPNSRWRTECIPELRIAFDFPDSQSLAWAVSDRDTDFLRMVNAYFSRMIPATASSPRSSSAITRRAENSEFVGPRDFMRDMQSQLPLYRKWFEEAAAQISQDWRLLAAIGYQESKWDPDAASASGAKGLMQLTSQSASEAKVDDPGDARQSIFGGARYFKQVMRKNSGACTRAGSYLVRAGRL